MGTPPLALSLLGVLMSNTSFVITLSVPSGVTEMGKYIKDTSEPRESCRSLSHLFDRIAQGNMVGQGPVSWDIQTSSGVVARATQVLTLTYASISNSDTCVVAGVTLTCVTGTPSGAQFKKQTDAPTTAANLVALVNSLATLNIYVKASNVLGVVTFTALAPGKVGNFLTLVGSTGMVATGSTFTGGTGGSETVAVHYARG